MRTLGTIGLVCACGEVAGFTAPDAQRAAYDAGWRLHRGEKLCPVCAEKIAQRLQRETERRRRLSS